MNETDSPHKTLSLPPIYDLDGASLPGSAGLDDLPRDRILSWLRSSDGKPCPVCLRMMRTEPLGSARNPTVDHIVARSRGGDGYPENLRVICRGCNSKKGAA